MKLQFKILILLSTIFGVIILSFLSYQYIRVQEKRIFYLENHRNQELVIDKVLQLNRVKYEQLINDNSSWDDMVSFVANPDLEWAKDNVDFFVNSFKLSFVLAYNREKELAYQFGDSVCLKGLKYPDQALINSGFVHSPFSHYFQYCGNELVEMFVATVVPASDADARKTPPQGYLFIGRKWSSEYLAEHTEATGYQTVIQKEPELSAMKKDPSKIYFFKSLADYSGKPLATLIFSKPDPLQHDLAPFLNLSFLLILVALLAMIVFLFYFRKIVLLPLSKINATLDTRNPEHIVPLNEHNDEFKVLGSMISEFFWQQEVLKKNNAELNEINATKDKLFSIIAHDLKNPVANIVAMSELLADFMEKKDMDTAEELTGLMGHQAKETLSLLDMLFDWARSQSGQMVFNPDILDLNQIVKEVLENLNSSAQLKGIVVFPPDIKEIRVFADVHMLATILRNLLANSIKFTKAGGIIQISALTNPENTEITISDSGIGMDQITQDMLFKIESNITINGTANEKGTGLGLIICKEFVEKHGGHIRVVSELGKGSQFILTFPFEKGTQ